MCSMRISPVIVSTASTAAWKAVNNWVAMVSRSRSTRSEIAPAKGETMTEGPRLQNARIPTQSAECVRVQASQSVAICCTHRPVQDRALQP